MDKPKVSVIVPIYNVELYLRRCVDSIRTQTLTDIEIILVDDGSTDACAQICDDYAAADPRIKVIHKKNGGLSDARNAGMKIMSGEYAGFVDGDDWIDPCMYDNLFADAKNYDTEITFGNYAKVIDGIIHPAEQKLEPGFYELGRLDLQECFNGQFMTELVCISLFKASFLKDYDLVFFDNAVVLSEDTLFIYEAYLSAKRISCINSLVYFYMYRQGSLINSASEADRLIKKVNMFRELYNYTKKHRNKDINSSPAAIIVFFWECWIASVYFYVNKNGSEKLVEMFNSIESMSFLKSTAFSLVCGKANRLFSKQKQLSLKFRLHLRLMAFYLLVGKYKKFIKGYF